MDDLRNRYQKQTFFLKQSLFYGDFYDDDSRSLVDARAFADLKFLTSPEGDIITPPPAKGILPAGTKVEITTIEFPTSAIIFKRPLFTPRYNVWVVLKVGRYSGDVDFYRPGDHIWVLPNTTRSEPQIGAALEAMLSQEDLTPWLAKRTDSARQAIAEKRAEKGLVFDELIAAWGIPDQVERKYEGEVEIELAAYGNTTVVLRNHVVTDIQTAEPTSL